MVALRPDQLTNLRNWVNREPAFRILQQTAGQQGCECFLTGGLVRDWFLGRATRDIDLAVSREALNLSREFARAVGGTHVLLKQDQDTARVVLPHLQFDFAGFRASNLIDDLRGRDFTINSIALPLTEAFGPASWEPIDPLNGAEDLSRAIIRRCGPDGFNQDPLRMLRAYRLKAQLQMEIEPVTRQALEQWGPLLNRSSPERRLYEWVRLLAQPAAGPALLLMNEDGILDILFPEFLPLRNTPQDGFHHLNVFDHSLLAFQMLEQALSPALSLPSEIGGALKTSLKNGDRRAYLKWTALVHDLGKPAAALRNDQRWTFHGHEQTGREMFHMIAGRLRLGHRARDYMMRLIGWHMRPFHLLQEKAAGKLTPRALVRMVKETNEDLNDLFLLALADCRAARGPLRPPDQEDRLIRLWQESLLVQKEILIPQKEAPPLVTGADLIRLGLPPGPRFKKLLRQISEDQWSGEITTREEALTRLQEMLSGD